MQGKCVEYASAVVKSLATQNYHLSVAFLFIVTFLALSFIKMNIGTFGCRPWPKFYQRPSLSFTHQTVVQCRPSTHQILVVLNVYRLIKSVIFT